MLSCWRTRTLFKKEKKKKKVVLCNLSYLASYAINKNIYWLPYLFCLSWKWFQSNRLAAGCFVLIDVVILTKETSSISSRYPQSVRVDLHQAVVVHFEFVTTEVEQKSGVDFRGSQAHSKAAGRAPDLLSGDSDRNYFLFWLDMPSWRHHTGRSVLLKLDSSTFAYLTGNTNSEDNTQLSFLFPAYFHCLERLSNSGQTYQLSVWMRNLDFQGRPIKAVSCSVMHFYTSL